MAINKYKEIFSQRWNVGGDILVVRYIIQYIIKSQVVMEYRYGIDAILYSVYQVVFGS